MFLTGSGARAEHYAIAAYNGLITIAQALGENDAVPLLRENPEAGRGRPRIAFVSQPAVAPTRERRGRRRAPNSARAAEGAADYGIVASVDPGESSTMRYTKHASLGITLGFVCDAPPEGE